MYTILSMINPAQISLTQPDGSARHVIIEPILEKAGGEQLRDTGVYKIYKDAFGDESKLFTEPKEIDEKNNDLPDDQNPDFLGKITLKGSDWICECELLSQSEMQEVVTFILNQHIPATSTT